MTQMNIRKHEKLTSKKTEGQIKATNEDNISGIILNRKDPALLKHFLQICQEKNINRAKLTRGKFKAFLQVKYKSTIAEKVKQFFTPFFSPSMDFEYFCDIFERLLNPQHIDKVQRLAHSVYDFNSDR